MGSPETAVIAANNAFYTAFAEDDSAAMEKLWSRDVPVACIHPGWDAIHGREDVMASWRAIFQRGAPPIECSDATVTILGPLAVVVCHEQIPGANLVATNVFVNERGTWRMILHQAAAVAEAQAEEPEPEPKSLN